MYTLVTSETQQPFENRDDTFHAFIDLIKVDGVYDFTQVNKYQGVKIIEDTPEWRKVISLHSNFYGDLDKNRQTHWKKHKSWDLPSFWFEGTGKINRFDEAMKEFIGNPQYDRIAEIISENFEVQECEIIPTSRGEFKVSTSQLLNWQTQYQEYLNTNFPLYWVPLPPGHGCTGMGPNDE